MMPTNFPTLLEKIRMEYKEHKSVFSVPVKIFSSKQSFKNEYMDIEMPFGPAAGPHTQLAQNIAAGYAAGARYFELKTVQVLDGEQLHINKPCIAGNDVYYNIEWSTELTIEQAFEEYVKAYFLLKFMAVEFMQQRLDGFSFNMSVGYDLAGIKSEKVDRFIDQMRNAEKTAIYQRCYGYLADHMGEYENFSPKDLMAVGTCIADSLTLSTMHGCPIGEIEKIAQYLICDKNLPLYIKLNPTLNGFSFTKDLLENKGYGDISLIEKHFNEDLALPEALLLIERLLSIASRKQGFFGVKLTNTLPVAVLHEELPDEQMYLSGKPLFLLALAVAQKLVQHFGTKLPVSFSGGLDKHNIKIMFETGIYPLTMASVLLKGKGYSSLSDYVDIFEKEETFLQKPSMDKVEAVFQAALIDRYYQKDKNTGNNKPLGKLPLLNCKNCRLCVMVCPNRANLLLKIKEKEQIVHIDAYCNECGNCETFCPYEGKPYMDKFTIFASVDAYENSGNPGMVQGKQTKIRQTHIDEDTELQDYRDFMQVLPKVFDLNR